MVPTPNSAGIVPRAIGRLTDGFRKGTNNVAILKSMLVGFPELQDQIWLVINNRILANNPVGDQLDQIGGLVGEARQGRGDAAYLSAIFVRIRVNRSRGLAEDVIQISNLLFSGALYDEFPLQKFLVSMWNVVSPFGFARLLFDAKALGAHGTLRYTTWSDDLDATFKNEGDSDSPEYCFDDITGSVADAGFMVSSVEVSR